MFIYYILIFISFILLVIFKGNLNHTIVLDCNNISSNDYMSGKTLKNRKKFVILISICLIVIIAFRDKTVGTDTYAYLREFNNTTNISFSTLSFGDFFKGEYGYKLLLVLMHDIGINWREFQVIYAVVVISTVGVFFYKHSRNIYVSYLLYITIGTFAMNLTGIRQTIAVTLCIGLYQFLEKKRYVIAVALYLLASSIHYTALIMGVIFLVNIILKDKKKLSLFWTGVGIIIPILSYFFIGDILNKFSFMLLNKYEYSGYYTELNSSLNPIVLFMYGSFTIYIFCGILWNKKNLNGTDIIFYVMSSIFLGCYLASGTVYMLARLSYYFSAFFIVSLTNTVDFLPLNKRSKMQVNFLLCVLCIMAFAISIPGNSYGIDKYIFSIKSY